MNARCTASRSPDRRTPPHSPSADGARPPRRARGRRALRYDSPRRIPGAMISLMRRCVPRSMPFVSETSSVPFFRCGAASCATERSANDGDAKTAISAFWSTAKSLVTAMRSGMRTPLSKGFSLVLSSNSAFFGSCDQSATVWPLSDNASRRRYPSRPSQALQCSFVLPRFGRVHMEMELALRTA